MMSRDPVVERAVKFVADHEAQMGQDFPEVFVDWFPRDDALYVESLSRHGTRSRFRMGYPADRSRLWNGVQRHVDSDAVRDGVSDQLVAAVGGYDASQAHLPYIVRWLVLPQGATVQFGDHPEVGPRLASPSCALIRTPTRRLKVWADGTAVLHYDDRRTTATEEPRESRGLDLTAITLRGFQEMWLLREDSGATNPVDLLLRELPPMSGEAAALRLLADYEHGLWLHHHRFAELVGDLSAEGHIDWIAANRLSVTHTEATVQDRAVLVVACHLSDRVAPLVSLLDALHHVGSGRDAVLLALDHLTGQHPAPGAAWPEDCPSCP